jgi:hypothetical protein
MLLDIRGTRVRFQTGANFLSSPQRTGQLWGPPSTLSKEYRGSLSLAVNKLQSDIFQEYMNIEYGIRDERRTGLAAHMDDMGSFYKVLVEKFEGKS